MYSFRERISVLGLLAALFLGVCVVARRYSPAIVAFVVEQALIQKAPDGVGPEQAQRRFDAWLSSAKPKDKVLKLLDLSKYLEKVQKLSAIEMEQLLEEGARAQRPRS